MGRPLDELLLQLQLSASAPFDIYLYLSVGKCVQTIGSSLLIAMVKGYYLQEPRLGRHHWPTTQGAGYGLHVGFSRSSHVQSTACCEFQIDNVVCCVGLPSVLWQSRASGLPACKSWCILVVSPIFLRDKPLLERSCSGDVCQVVVCQLITRNLSGF